MKLTTRLAIIAWFCSCSILIFSCSNAERPQEAVIFYYPEQNVYYDSLRSNYYFSLDGAVTWDSLAFSGPQPGKALGASVAIQRTSDSIWQYNALHRKKYNGVLLNTVNAYTIALTRADRISKLRTVVKAATQSQTIKPKDSTPPEKGLKKFFHKIFGKKKKTGSNDNE